MMQLDRRQKRQFEKALLSAFPRKADLNRMVSFGLDENIDAIAKTGRLSDVVFELIEWASSRNKIRDLIIAALEANSDCQELNDFASQLGAVIHQPVGSMPSPSQLTWQERRELHQLLTTTFSTTGQLRIICVFLGIPYAELKGSDLPSQIENLMQETERLGCAAELRAAAQEEANRQAREKEELEKAGQQAIEAAKRKAWVHNQHGFNHFKQQRYDAAIVEYNRAIKLRPNHATFYYNRGLAFYAQQRYNEARADYTHAIKLNRTYAVDYFQRGLTYYAQRRYDEARADYTHAIQIDTQYAHAYFHRGLTYCAQQRYDEARADYTHAIQIDTQYAHAYFHRGLTYYAQQRYNEARADYTHAIQLEPNFAIAYHNRALTYVAQGCWREAHSDYICSIRHAPTLALAQSNTQAPTKATYSQGYTDVAAYKLIQNPLGPRLEIEGRGVVVQLPDKDEILIGVADIISESSGILDLDLTPYGGLEAGVSRKHARILRQDKSYLLEDLNSTNYTRLNGQKLVARMPTLITNSSRIELGKLVVFFRISEF